MLPGFKLRLLQELKHMIEFNSDFEELLVHKDKVAIPDCVFAPNVT